MPLSHPVYFTNATNATESWHHLWVKARSCGSYEKNEKLRGQAFTIGIDFGLLEPESGRESRLANLGNDNGRKREIAVHVGDSSIV